MLCCFVNLLLTLYVRNKLININWILILKNIKLPWNWVSDWPIYLSFDSLQMNVQILRDDILAYVIVDCVFSNVNNNNRI